MERYVFVGMFSRCLIFLELTVLLMLAGFTGQAGCEVYKTLQWTPDNPKFLTNVTNCRGGEALQMNVLPNSKVFVACPNTITVLDTVQSPKPKHELFENLWIVYDKERFGRCDANATSPKPSQEPSRRLMECDKPLELKYYAIVFQEFSAVSDGLEFKTGREYYFLATSDGSQGTLYSGSGGHCNDTQNGVAMKFKVYVCNNKNDSRCRDTSKYPLGELFCNKTSTLTPEATTPTTAHSTGTSQMENRSTTAPNNADSTTQRPTTTSTATEDDTSESTVQDGSEPQLSKRQQDGSSYDGRILAIAALCLLVFIVLWIGGICVWRWKNSKNGPTFPLVVVDTLVPCCSKNNNSQVQSKENLPFPYGNTNAQGNSNEGYDPDHFNDQEKDKQLDKKRRPSSENEYANAENVGDGSTDSHIYKPPPEANQVNGKAFVVPDTPLKPPTGKLPGLTFSGRPPNGTNGVANSHMRPLSTFGHHAVTLQSGFDEQGV